MLQIRDQLSARQDDIRAMITRVGGTVDYLGMVRRVRADMRRLLPPAARVVVISKGDPDLLDVEGQDAVAFPAGRSGALRRPLPRGEWRGHRPSGGAKGTRRPVSSSSPARHPGGSSITRAWHTISTPIIRGSGRAADCQIYELDSVGSGPAIRARSKGNPTGETDSAAG